MVEEILSGSDETLKLAKKIHDLNVVGWLFLLLASSQQKPMYESN